MDIMIRRKFQPLQASALYKMASPSNTTTTSTLVSSCSSAASSRHRTMSDLVPSLSFPLTDSDGGHGRFSWKKKSLRFPSRNWDATCNLEKRLQCDFYSAMTQLHSVGPLALVWCIEQVYSVQLHEFNNAWLVLLTVKYPFRNPAYMWGCKWDRVITSRRWTDIHRT